MSKAAAVKLSPALKALISSPAAKGSALPSPGASAINDLFGKIVKTGEQNGVSKETWLTLGTAAIMTVNSPPALGHLYDFAAGSGDVKEKGQVAAVSGSSISHQRFGMVWREEYEKFGVLM